MKNCVFFQLEENIIKIKISKVSLYLFCIKYNKIINIFVWMCKVFIYVCVLKIMN